jgi:hypothetical protein
MTELARRVIILAYYGAALTLAFGLVATAVLKGGRST